MQEIGSALICFLWITLFSLHIWDFSTSVFKLLNSHFNNQVLSSKSGIHYQIYRAFSFLSVWELIWEESKDTNEEALVKEEESKDTKEETLEKEEETKETTEQGKTLVKEGETKDANVSTSTS